MKTIKFNLSLVIIAGMISIISSCDIVNPPYEQTGSTVDTTTYKRKILVEDYTGHYCPNCPNAAVALKQLEQDYPDRIVGVASHVSNFAYPGPGIFNFDFRTTCGNDWDAQFGVSLQGLPKGMVNRVGYPTSNHVMEYTIWDDTVASLINLPADASLEISNVYNSSSNTVETTISSKFVNALSGNYFLSVVYTEDSIIQPQSLPSGSPQPVDTFYVHMHALRGDINGSWGEKIATDPAENFTVSKTYTKQLVSGAVPEHCKVVAFIYKEGTYEVIQAEEKHVK